MSDDLVKRLRMVTGFIRFETGDRIAASACLSEEAADHIEELEVKLVETICLARDAINGLVDSGDAFEVLNATLKEIKGEKDD